MEKRFLELGLLVLILTLALTPLCMQKEGSQKFQQNQKVKKMDLTSSAFEHEGKIPAKYTCDGDDIIPPLNWSQVPDDTQAYALICVDPDAPMGEFVHLMAYNIPVNVTEVEEAQTVPGQKVKNDFGKEEYGGPCPPSGTHRYYFTVYALNSTLTDVDKGNLREKLKEKTLAKATLMGTYSRE